MITLNLAGTIFCSGVLSAAFLAGFDQGQINAIVCLLAIGCAFAFNRAEAFQRAVELDRLQARINNLGRRP